MTCCNLNVDGAGLKAENSTCCSSLNMLQDPAHTSSLYQMDRYSSGDRVWRKDEAVIDSGAVDTVANRRRYPHLSVKQNEASQRGDQWECAGGTAIKKEGEVRLKWFSNEGAANLSTMQIGAVKRTLISAKQLVAAGNDVVLSKKHPRIVHQNGSVTRLRRSNGMFILDMWYQVPKHYVQKASAHEDDEPMEIAEVVQQTGMRSGFTRQGA